MSLSESAVVVGGGGTASMRMTALRLALVAFVPLVAGGCGQEVKKENEQLKAQVAALQKENLALRGESTSLKADAEAMKKQIDILTKERLAIDEKVKDLEAKVALKPSKTPPVKPKKMSMP